MSPLKNGCRPLGRPGDGKPILMPEASAVTEGLEVLSGYAITARQNGFFFLSGLRRDFPVLFAETEMW